MIEAQFRDGGAEIREEAGACASEFQRLVQHCVQDSRVGDVGGIGGCSDVDCSARVYAAASKTLGIGVGWTDVGARDAHGGVGELGIVAELTSAGRGEYAAVEV